MVCTCGLSEVTKYYVTVHCGGYLYNSISGGCQANDV